MIAIKNNLVENIRFSHDENFRLLKEAPVHKQTVSRDKAFTWIALNTLVAR